VTEAIRDCCNHSTTHKTNKQASNKQGTMVEAAQAAATSDLAHQQANMAIHRATFKFGHFLALCCIFSALWCVVTSFTQFGVLEPTEDIAQSEWSDGCQDGLQYCICPRETVCADRIVDLVYLGIARTSIYMVYPFLICLFLSKSNHLTAYLQTTVFSVFVEFADMHHVHVFGAKVVEYATWIHVFFHLLRWGTRDNGNELTYLWETQTGLTGLIAVAVMPLITWPMRFERFRKRLSYEYRKGLHYLSWIWMVAMVLHAPATHIFYLCGIPLLIYWLNYIAGIFRGTYLVPSTVFRRLGSGTSLSFINPPGFELKGASYIMVMLPWISRTQWHAFSVFPHPTQENASSVCIAALGDWSKQLHETIIRPTSRAVWVNGPYLSPFATAIDFDNIITLATGIGITPALAVMNLYKGTRRVNLVWMCRDPSFVEFFISTVEFPEDSFVMIYYTGKKDLVLDDLPFNVFLFRGRPKLDRVISGIVHSIETEIGLPENIVEEGKMLQNMSAEEKFRAMFTRLFNEYSPTEIFEYAAEQSSLKDARLNGDVEERKGGGRDSVLSNKKSMRRLSLGASVRSMRLSRASGVHSDSLVNKVGLIACMNNFIGGNAFTSADIDEIFNKFDNDGDGMLDRKDFLSMYISYEDGDLNKDYDSSSSDDDSSLSDDSLNDDDNDPYDSTLVDRNEHGISDNASTDNMRGGNPKLFNSLLGLVHASKKTKKTNHQITKFFQPENKNKGKRRKSVMKLEEDEDLAMKFCLEHPVAMGTWQMLYCGGSAPVVRSLKNINKTLGIDLKVEKFDW